MRKIILYILSLAVFSVSLVSDKLLGEQVLKALDDLQTLQEDVSAIVEIVEQDTDQGTKVMEGQFYGRNLQDLFLMVLTRPESEKGNGYLKAGGNFWMYRRNTRTFQHINRDENIAGSDANAGDFEASKYQEQYRVSRNQEGKEIITEETLGKIPVYRLVLVAKVPDVDYPKKTLWVRQDNYLPLKEQSFALSGTLMYTHYYLGYTVVKGRYVAIKHLVIDEFEKGNKTMWEIKSIRYGHIDDKVFTKAYLESLSK